MQKCAESFVVFRVPGSPRKSDGSSQGVFLRFLIVMPHRFRYPIAYDFILRPEDFAVFLYVRRCDDRPMSQRNVSDVPFRGLVFLRAWKP